MILSSVVLLGTLILGGCSRCIRNFLPGIAEIGFLKWFSYTNHVIVNSKGQKTMQAKNPIESTRERQRAKSGSECTVVNDIRRRRYS